MEDYFLKLKFVEWIWRWEFSFDSMNCMAVWMNEVVITFFPYNVSNLSIHICKFFSPKLCIICKLHYPRSVDILIYKDTHLPSLCIIIYLGYLFSRIQIFVHTQKYLLYTLYQLFIPSKIPRIRTYKFEINIRIPSRKISSLSLRVS